MKRAVVLSLVVAYLTTATAFAQEPIRRPASAPKPVTFGSIAPAVKASVAAALSQMKLPSFTTPAPRVIDFSAAPAPALAPAPKAGGSGGHSFWKSPWPYIIAGGVVAGIVIAKKSGGYKSNTPGCNDPSCAIY